MDPDMETVELDQISLPPIPGPLPPSFFVDITQSSAAIFSTLLGTRPFRPLPNPAPVHAIRSGSESDIREKSCYLFKNYPTIAELIVTPPTTWQDLYHYFDAVDLWTEGAGFLFHVLGHIVRVNLTKRHFLENYTRNWVFLNQERLSNMVPRQDMLSSLQTSDDHAWFDYDNMTFHDKEVLNSLLRWHCEALQTKRISTPILNQNEPVQIATEPRRAQPAMQPMVPVQVVVEAQRTLCNIAADPYQHFGRLDYKLPPRLSNKQSQPTAKHWESSESQSRVGSVLLYRNRNSIQSHGGHWGSFRENPHQVAVRNDPIVTENRYISVEGNSQFGNDQRQRARDGNPHGPFQRHSSVSTAPVYVLDHQKSLVSLHKEAFGVQVGDFAAKSPMSSSQRPPNFSFQRRNSQGHREDISYPNHKVFLSNDARFHHDGRFKPVDGGGRSMSREHFKHTARKSSWPESDSNKVRTVQVTGFPAEASSGCRLEKLFSECGEIASVSVVDEKFCAFITFKYPSSALAAINHFNGYSMEGGKSLTVRYSKGNRRKSCYGNIDSQQPIPGASLQPWVHDLVSAPMHDTSHDNRENRKFMRTTPPRNDSYTLLKRSHTLPPNPFEQARDGGAAQIVVPAVESRYLESQLPNLPAKPQHSFSSSTWNDSPSSGSKARSNCIQDSLRSPGETQHGSRFGHTSTHQRKDNVDRSGQNAGRRTYGPENSRTQRKTPKKQKIAPHTHKAMISEVLVDAKNCTPQGSTPTNSPIKLPSPTPVGNLNTDGKETDLARNTTSPVLSNEPRSNGGTAEISTANGVAAQLQDLSVCNSECLQMDVSTSNSDVEFDPITSCRPECCNVSSKHCGSCEDTLPHEMTLASESTQVTATDVGTVGSASSRGPYLKTKESNTNTELIRQQKKKKPKNKMRSPDQSSRSSQEMIRDTDVSPTKEIHPKNGSRNRSKENAKPHLSSQSNTTSSSTGSSLSQVRSTNAETAVSPTHDQNNRKAGPGRNSIGSASPQEDSRRQPHRTTRSSQSKSSNDDDVFQDTKPALAKHPQDPKQLSQDENVSAKPPTSNSNSSYRNTESQDWDESQTPTRKPQPKHRINTSDPKPPFRNLKENRKQSPSPTEILSDPSNWPSLGSTKLQIDPKAGGAQKTVAIVKPLTERPLPQAPIRRDSMASVVSQPPQIVRRLTTDGLGSPVSGGSPLWPVVKRWDGHGRPPAENGDTAPLIPDGT